MMNRIKVLLKELFDKEDLIDGIKINIDSFYEYNNVTIDQIHQVYKNPINFSLHESNQINEFFGDIVCSHRIPVMSVNRQLHGFGKFSHKLKFDIRKGIINNGIYFVLFIYISSHTDRSGNSGVKAFTSLNETLDCIIQIKDKLSS